MSCTTRNGKWTEPVHLVTIDVEMAWYKRWWFILCCMAAAVSFTIWMFVSALRRKEDRLNIELKEKEKTASEDKVRFLINVSHEMRTPLTLIIAPMKRLLKHTDPSSPHFETLNMVYRQANRMKELLNTVLDLRKMEMTENKLKTETVDFNAWLTSILEDYVSEGKISGIKFRTELSPETGKVNLDRRKCETVMTNLLINALRYSGAGSTVTVRSMKTDSGSVRVEVSDQGPGLHGIDPDKLFTRFYQRDNEHSGSGIGLSYAKILVELHGGKIGAMNNEDGPGATFWFELPSDIPLGEIVKEPRSYLNELIETGDGAMPVPDNGHGTLPEQDPARKKVKLLVVDDNRDFTGFIRSSFEKYAEVYMAYSGRQALDVLKRVTPDIIVSDVNMPDGDGYELCRTVKENIEYSHIPVILLTAQNDERNQRESYKTGAAAFLSKPFEVETLYELIRSILKERDVTRHRYLQDFSIADTARGDFSAADEGFLSKLNNFIEEHLDNPDLDITMICKGVGVSRALLYNKLKAIAGVGANEYISRIRMNRAVKMVEDSDLSFAEIAEKVGFATASYFSTAFKKYTDLSPTQWREKKRILP